VKLSECTDAERRALAALEPRIGRVHLRQRLGLEGEHEARVVRPGTHFFHLENWYSVHALIRLGLTLVGLHGRGRRNALRIQLRHHDFVLENLPPAFDGYTLLHLSDLHLDMSEAHLASLIQSLQGLEYDSCVLTGDFRFRTFGPYTPAVDALARLRPHLRGPVFAVLGNHDTIRMVPPMEALDMRVLVNESVRIERENEALYLAGIDDAHYFRTHNFHKAAQDIPQDACSVLLSHTPEPYRHAAHAGFSLMLSGHTHGGQICLPGGAPIITDSDAPRAYARGAWRFNSMAGYTSVGCGSSIVDVRLNCPPEITLLRLRPARAGKLASPAPFSALSV
jgi:predicted MPP superfamily phosphohydrolase